MRVVTSPEDIPQDSSFKLFLAGSIERGRAREWQDEVIDQLTDLDLTILNPRRSAWDESWSQEADFAPFREQVEWELSALEACDAALMYFQASTRSPVSMLELGLFRYKMIVVCEEGFWRRGNVQITCERYSTDFVSTLEEGVPLVREMILSGIAPAKN